MVTDNLLHRSGRAGFRHPALASGDDAKPPRSVPASAAVLAAPRQGAMPELADLESEEVQRRAIHGRSEAMSTGTVRSQETTSNVSTEKGASKREGGYEEQT